MKTMKTSQIVLALSALLLAACGGGAATEKKEMTALAKNAPPPPGGNGEGTELKRNVSKEATSDFASAVEFYNATLDHYFLTHIANEIALLDAGTTIRG